MRAEELKARLKSEPWMPFRIYMSDGSSYDIKHPEVALLTRHSLEVGVNEKDGIPDHSVRCNILHITRVEDLVRRTKVAASHEN
jgi:hypothetical protein